MSKIPTSFYRPIPTFRGHRCVVTSVAMDSDSFAPHFNAKVECRHGVNYTTKLCPATLCQDPLTMKILPQNESTGAWEVEPVVEKRRLNYRTRVDVTTACRCVLKKNDDPLTNAV